MTPSLLLHYSAILMPAQKALWAKLSLKSLTVSTCPAWPCFGRQLIF